MKKIAVVLLTIMFAVGCSSKKAASANADKAGSGLSFEYEASTRGAFKKVVVTQDSIVTIKDRDMKDVVTKAVKKADWEALVALNNKINSAGIKDLKAPSNKNHADAALAAKLTVIVADQVYNSAVFDHGNPPAEIAPLVNKIIAMSDLKTK